MERRGVPGLGATLSQGLFGTTVLNYKEVCLVVCPRSRTFPFIIKSTKRVVKEKIILEIEAKECLKPQERALRHGILSQVTWSLVLLTII